MTLHFKLDENASPAWREPLEADGHTVSTIFEQGLAGATDQRIAAVCDAEKLCLVTADLDFAQIADYPPSKHAGIVVLRHPRPTTRAMLQLVQQLALGVQTESPVGRLWIVEPGRIRIRQP